MPASRSGRSPSVRRPSTRPLPYGLLCKLACALGTPSHTSRVDTGEVQERDALLLPSLKLCLSSCMFSWHCSWSRLMDDGSACSSQEATKVDLQEPLVARPVGRTVKTCCANSMQRARSTTRFWTRVPPGQVPCAELPGQASCAVMRLRHKCACPRRSTASRACGQITSGERVWVWWE